MQLVHSLKHHQSAGSRKKIFDTPLAVCYIIVHRSYNLLHYIKNNRTVRNNPAPPPTTINKQQKQSFFFLILQTRLFVDF